MSRAKALGNLLKLGWKRLEPEKGLDETAQKVRERTTPTPIEQEQPLPSELPNTNTPAAGPAAQTQAQAGKDPKAKLTDVDPVTPAESRGVEAAALETPETLQHSNLNRRRIETEGDVGGLVDELIRLQKAKGLEIGPAETFEGVKDRAKGLSWRQITDKADNKSPLNIEELRYAREVEADLLSDLQQRALDVLEQRRLGTLSPEVEYQFRLDTGKIAAISRYISGEKRRTAQILASLRDTAGNDFLRGVQRDEFLRSVGTGSKSIDNIAASLVAARSVDEAVKTIDPWGKVRTASRYMGNVWYNSILSQFAVAKAAIGGVVINKMLFPVESLTSAAVSKVRKVAGADLGGQPGYNREVLAGEAAIEVMGVFTGFADALGPILKHLKDPHYNMGRTAFGKVSSTDDVLLWNAAKNKSMPVNIMAQLVDAVTQNGSRRLLAMTDMMVKSMAFQQKTKALAYRISANEGLEGDALMKRVAEALDEMPDEMFERAFNSGREATLTQDLWPLLETINKPFIKVPGVKFFAPFTTTMLAGVQLAMERMPFIGMAMSPQMRKAWQAGGAARDEIIGRWTVGATLMGAGVYMAMNDQATSGYAMTKSEQFSRMKSGWRPTSFVRDDSYISANFLSPAHEIMFVGVTIGEMLRYVNNGIPPEDPRHKDNLEVMLELSYSLAFMFADVTLNKSIGRSLRELLESIDDPARHAERKVSNVATPFLSLFGTKMLRRGIDDVRRRVPTSDSFVQTLIGNVRNNTPGLSDDLPPAVGYFGESKPEYSMLDLFAYSPHDPNVRLWAMLQRNNINTSNPSAEVAMPAARVKINLDQDITPDLLKQSYIDDNPEAEKRGYAYYRYSQIRGEALKEVLSELDKSGELENLPVGEPMNQDAVYTQGDLIIDMRNLAFDLAAKKFEAEMAGAMTAKGGYEGLVTRALDKPQEVGIVAPGVNRALEAQEERINVEF